MCCGAVGVDTDFLFQIMDARSFLKNNGLEELITIVVEDNKVRDNAR